MNFAALLWDPSREIFVIPYLHLPVLWYSLLFALGFLGGYLLFAKLLKRYFLQSPLFTERDIRSFSLFLERVKRPQNESERRVQKIFFSLLDSSQKNLLFKGKETEEANALLLQSLNRLFDHPDVLSWMQEDPKRQRVRSSRVFRNPQMALVRLFLEQELVSFLYPLKKKAQGIADRLLLYMMAATVIGARLGHLLFYEKISFYFLHPLDVLKTWQGGLASHGAAVAILIALFFFCRSLKEVFGWRTLLDLIAAPTAFAAVCIRLGNFFNQEILGKPTSLPWAVIFGHPMDESLCVARHAVQLYEAFAYFLVFLVLLFLSGKPKFLLRKGAMMGIFLISVFTFRFFLEFMKVTESLLMAEGSWLEMGQWLSIPFILLGFFLFFWRDSKQKVDAALFS
jgi:phosphatidylglycerol---prolipoprotein diacylglyceryl transferase